MAGIRVMVAGACGRMGSETARAVLQQKDMVLAGAADICCLGDDLGPIIGTEPLGVTIVAAEEAVIRQMAPEVMVDFTNPQSVLGNAKNALRAGVVPVIGSTGLDDEDLRELRELSEEVGVGVFIAPNFALGALLMMRFAEEAAKYFPHVEIIEYHHDQKLDAPSGTALRTAEKIVQVRGAMFQGHPNEYEKLPGARGGDYNGVKVHAVRLPGMLAHQEVLFGGAGQTLSIRHDTYTRETYMPGVLMAIRRSRGLKGFVVGLEKYLDT
ncbi:MAG: 4-hydroxy-tetrahydrodipicolinate reductase [Gracilibacteraceae bacterium]|nr:4-hydroxy-tetrahydrodipicolinate reductase [Gracilibacteraceae bacterium]